MTSGIISYIPAFLVVKLSSGYRQETERNILGSIANRLILITLLHSYIISKFTCSMRQKMNQYENQKWRHTIHLSYTQTNLPHYFPENVLICRVRLHYQIEKSIFILKVNLWIMENICKRNSLARSKLIWNKCVIKSISVPCRNPRSIRRSRHVNSLHSSFFSYFQIEEAYNYVSRQKIVY